MDGFDSVVFNVFGEEGLEELDYYKILFLSNMAKLFDDEKVHVDRVDGKSPVWYGLATDEHSSPELLKYWFEHSDFVEEDPLTPQECDFLLREMFSEYEISDEKLRILIDHGFVSSGKKTVYEPDPDYDDEDMIILNNLDCNDENAPNALFYAIINDYPVSVLKLLHEKANVPYDVDSMGVPFIVHAMENKCSDAVIRYLSEIAEWSELVFEGKDDSSGPFGVDLSKPDYSSINFATGNDRFGNDIGYYVSKYEKRDLWKSIVDEWADDYASIAMEDYDAVRKPYSN